MAGSDNALAGLSEEVLALTLLVSVGVGRVSEIWIGMNGVGVVPPIVTRGGGLLELQPPSGTDATLGESTTSTSVVPSQKLASLARRLPPGVVALSTLKSSCGSAAVTPRIGSVSSCSGDGKARGERSTLAAAHLMAATAVVISVFELAVLLLLLAVPAVDAAEEKELRVLCDEPGSESWRGRSIAARLWNLEAFGRTTMGRDGASSTSGNSEHSFGMELDSCMTSVGLLSPGKLWYDSGGFGILWGSQRPMAYAEMKVAQSQSVLLDDVPGSES